MSSVTIFKHNIIYKKCLVIIFKSCLKRLKFSAYMKNSFSVSLLLPSLPRETYTAPFRTNETQSSAAVFLLAGCTLYITVLLYSSVFWRECTVLLYSTVFWQFVVSKRSLVSTSSNTSSKTSLIWEIPTLSLSEINVMNYELLYIKIKGK